MFTSEWMRDQRVTWRWNMFQDEWISCSLMDVGRLMAWWGLICCVSRREEQKDFRWDAQSKSCTRMDDHKWVEVVWEIETMKRTQKGRHDPCVLSLCCSNESCVCEREIYLCELFSLSVSLVALSLTNHSHDCQTLVWTQKRSWILGESVQECDSAR